MRLSKSSSYAIRSLMLVYEEHSRNKQNISLGEITKKLGGSAAYAAKVLQKLTKAGMIMSTKGPGGGFLPSESTAKTSLLEVINLIEGENYCCECMLGKRECSAKNPCPIHDQVVGYRDSMVAVFKKTTIEYLSANFRDSELTIEF